MNKDTVKYINGERNATKDEFIIGREAAGKRELIFVSLPEHKKPLYALWNNKNTAKRYKRVENKENNEVTFEHVQPKGTGGRPLYVMIMVNEYEKLMGCKISLEARGAIFSFSDCIEWNTNRIYRKRDGKSMTREMIAQHLKSDMYKTKLILKELIGLKVISYDAKKQAYFLNKKILRKGASE